MANVTVIGAQWGDEGKGKIVDWLASRADAVVRFQGGHNAGHTLVVGDVTYKLSLLPSGIVTGTLSIIGNGVVLDPWALKAEVEKLTAQGVTINPENFAIADNCPLILPLHRDLDGLREAAAGAGKIGTTGRGIGPAYEDKVGRRAIRVCDLAHLDSLDPQIDRLCAHHNALRAGFGEDPVDREQLVAELREIAPYVLQFAQPVWKRLNKVRKAGAMILFEGAQGALLDVDHGTYPYVTSSNTTAGGASTGSGVGPRELDYVLGIVKAYATRVGGGPFPTELDNDIGQHIRDKGAEYGTVTKRPRRCGWFDAVAARRSIFNNSVTGLCVTKLDVLDELDVIRFCVGYRVDGMPVEVPPIGAEGFLKIEAVYEELPGWKQSTYGIKRYDELPEAARNYLKRMEEITEAEVAMISTGPDRDHTIVLRNPFG